MRILLLLLLACCALGVAACRSVPVRSAALDEARAAVAAVGPASELSPEARSELERAEVSLRAAEAARARRESADNIAHLAYVAQQRAALAREREALKRTEQQVERATAVRERSLIEARDRALEAQQRATDLAAAAKARGAEGEISAARLQQPAPPAQAVSERPLTDAERETFVAEARRAALAEREEREMRARSSAALAAARKPGRSAPVTKDVKNGKAATVAAVKSAAAVEPKAPVAPAKPAARNDSDGLPEATQPPHPSGSGASAAEPTRALNVPAQGSVVTLTDDSFHSGAPYLRPGATRSIDPVADFLRANPNRKVRVVSIAPAAARELSKGRANEVRGALTRRGVAANRIQVLAASEADGHEAARVDIVISDESGHLAAR